MNENNKKLEKNTLIAISTLFIVWGIAFIYRSSFIAMDDKRYFCLFDDAMISMRYAWNLSHGLGLVWNQGEYVQGYTNLLMTLLMSVATFIFDKSAAVLFIQVIGIGFILASAYISMQIVDYAIPDMSGSAYMRILVFFGSLSYYPLVYWSLMGMETGLLTLLLLSGILFTFRYVQNKNISELFYVSVFFSLAYLTRNDSIIYAVLAWIYILADIFFEKTNKTKTSDKVQTLSFLGLYIFVILGQSGFQYFYYGEILPNTYTLKLTGMPLLARIQNGIGFITPFITQTFFVLTSSTILLIFGLNKQKILLIACIYAAISYQIYVGGDPWIYWRITSPAMPLLIMLYLFAIDTIVSKIIIIRFFKTGFSNTSSLLPKIVAVMLTFMMIVGLLLINASFFKQIVLYEKPYTAEANRKNTNVAIALNELTTNGATVGVYWAGSIPYYTGMMSIDFLGKSDRYIAQLPPDLSGATGWNGMISVPGHNKYDLNYSIKILKPTYIQGFQWGRQDLSSWSRIHYTKVNFEGVELYLLKDSPFVRWDKLQTR
jgi:hypothetical protein